MNKVSFESLVGEIVENATELVLDTVGELDLVVTYACIFTHSDEEYLLLSEFCNELGVIVDDTPTGPVYRVSEIETVSGSLDIVKIRKADSLHLDRGDADFRLKDYPAFKAKYLGQTGFSLIVRPDFEMIELMKPRYDVRAYFSNPPVAY